jgi:hypothetical protein
LIFNGGVLVYFEFAYKVDILWTNTISLCLRQKSIEINMKTISEDSGCHISFNIGDEFFLKKLNHCLAEGG